MITLGPLPGATAEYVIQPEDVLSVRVTGEPALSQNYTVDDGGDIVMEMVGKVHVAGLITKQAQEKLTKELEKYLKLFEVTVLVVGETGSRILVYGEVARPGSVKLRPGAKLLDVLAEAGQPTANADTQRIAIARASGEKTEIVDLEAVLRDPSLNAEIKPGDTVTVPSKISHSVRVDGEVRSPGFKPLEDVKTAYAAIQSAGPTEQADWSRVILRRKDSNIPLTIDLSRVRTGQLKDDLQLQAGDHLTVMSKFSGMATLRGEVRNAGEKDLNGPTQVWDFILSAGGGLTDRADRRRVQVIRAGQPVRIVDLEAVANGTRRSDDPELEVLGGDLIFVPVGAAVLRGEVKSQGEKPIGNTTNIWDFIMTAGQGFTDNADRAHVQVIRNGKLVQTVDLTEVASGQKAADDEALQVLSGDVISVPNDEKNRFAIVGGVRKPGKYTARPGMTLLDAIAAAEGPTDRVSKQIVVVPADRYDAQGQFKAPPQADAGASDPKKKENLSEYGLVVVDYRKLLRGDPTQNVTIRPGDRILVPENPPPGAPRKPSFFESVLRMVPFAGLLLGGGYSPYGY